MTPEALVPETAPPSHTPGGRTRPLSVFVHLAADKDVVAWREARRAGTLVGVNDETPYGYGRAEKHGLPARLFPHRSGRAGRQAAPARISRRYGFDMLQSLFARAGRFAKPTSCDAHRIAVSRGRRPRRLQPLRPKILGRASGYSIGGSVSTRFTGCCFAV